LAQWAAVWMHTLKSGQAVAYRVRLGRNSTRYRAPLLGAVEDPAIEYGSQYVVCMTSYKTWPAHLRTCRCRGHIARTCP
jgi:hypothetical protein